MPPRHPDIAHALGLLRPVLDRARLAVEISACEASPIPVVVACSGGADSMALLGLLACIQGAARLQLIVAHVDHGLRASSREEARRVVAVARDRGLVGESVRLRLDPGPGLAARAREARRAALRELARQHGAAIVALGHTATDQAETVLMHLARGAGLEGLAAMAEVEVEDGRAWMRPLLHLSRAQTRELAVRLELPIIDDPTNLDESHPRVAVRQRVMPVLRGFRADADRAIAALCERAREAEDALNMWAMREIEARTDHDDALDLQAFAALPRAVRTRVLRMYCHARGVDPQTLGRAALAAIDRSLCSRGGDRSWDLRPHRRLRCENGTLRVEARSAEEYG